MKRLLILIAFLTASCAPKELVVQVNVNNQPWWVQDFTAMAADFWADHQVTFDVGKIGALHMSAIGLQKSEAGECDCEVWGSGTIFLSPVIADYPDEGTCIVAHELGHSVGLHHTKSGLMFPIVTLDNGECPWSDDDQAEFERANPDAY